MKKIILTSIICAALFLTGCSKHELTYFKFPTNNSYAFILNSSDVITEIKCKTYDSQNTRVVNENEILTVSRDSGKNYCETIENPHRKFRKTARQSSTKTAMRLETSVLCFTLIQDSTT